MIQGGADGRRRASHGGAPWPTSETSPEFNEPSIPSAISYKKTTGRKSRWIRTHRDVSWQQRELKEVWHQGRVDNELPEHIGDPSWVNQSSNLQKEKLNGFTYAPWSSTRCFWWLERAIAGGNGDGSSFFVFDEIQINSRRWLGPHGFNRWEKGKREGGFEVL